MKRVLGIAVVLLLMAVALPVWGTNDITCKSQPGFTENLEAGSYGDWGSVDFVQDDGVLTLTVNEGYEVALCVKKGSDGPAVTGFKSEGVYVFDVPDFPGFPGSAGDGFSHYGLIFRTVPGGSTTTTIDEGTTTTIDEGTTTTIDEGTTTTVQEETTTTVVETTTTDGGTTVPETLPFTGVGDSPGLWVSAAVGLLALGGLAFRVARGMVDSE